MPTPRVGHSLTVLANGKVLAAGGGYGGDGSIAELYDPSTNTWSSAGSMSSERYGHTATLLANGKVLVVGGAPSGDVATAELYDPSSNSWSAAGRMDAARTKFSVKAVLLANGKVLVVGPESRPTNDNRASFVSSAELYDPDTNSWSPAGGLLAFRAGPTVTLLSNGKVLVAGGSSFPTYEPLSSAELYDPVSNSWSAAGSMLLKLSSHTATLMGNGKVLVACEDHAELYDPSSNRWTRAGNLKTARINSEATLLGNGKVLIIGGYNSSSGYLSSTELYDPISNSWSDGGSMAVARDVEDDKAVLLANGKVLVVGGGDAVGAELYTPGLDTITTVNPSPVSAVVGQNLTVKISLNTLGLPNQLNHAQGQALAPPTGRVTVYDGEQSCAFFLPNLQCSLPLTQAGSHNLWATYSGDASHNASTSMPVTVNVQADPNDSDGDGIPNAVESAAGLNPNSKDNNLLANTVQGKHLFVQQQFRDLLFREGSSSAVSYWDNQMAQGMTRNQVILAFTNSGPANSQIKPLARLFTALFGNLYANTSINGFVSYAKALAANQMDLNTIAGKLVSSTAFSNIYGSLNDSDFASIVLTNVLGHSPSAQEVSTAASTIAASSRAAWLKQQSEQPAFVSASATKIYFEWIYLSLSRKVPTAQGEQYWLERLNANAPAARVELVDAFLGTLLPNYSGAATGYYNRFMPALQPQKPEQPALLH